MGAGTRPPGVRSLCLNEGGKISTLPDAVGELAARLNDPRCSKISDPRKNAWPVTFMSTDVHELAYLAQVLEAFGIEFQTTCFGKTRSARNGHARI